MAFPTPVTQPVFRVTLYFNTGAWGWTEAYLFTAPTLNYTLMSTQLPRLCALRKAFLSNLANIVGIRLSAMNDDTTVQSTKIFFTRADGCGPGALDDPKGQATIGNGVLCDVRNDTGLYHRALILRGLPFDAARWSPDVLQPDYPPEFLGPLNIFLGQLQNPNPNAINGLSYRSALRGRIHDPAINLQTDILSGVTSADGCHVDITVNDAALWNLGEPVHVHNVRGTNYKGIDGDGKILTLTDNTFKFSRKPCCCGTTTLTANGFAYLILYAWYFVDSAVLERTVKRATGRPFFGTRGRRRRCSC